MIFQLILSSQRIFFKIQLILSILHNLIIIIQISLQTHIANYKKIQLPKKRIAEFKIKYYFK